VNKKILIISQYFFPEQFRINDIAASLVNRGYDVTVLTGLPNYPKGKFLPGFNWFNLKKEAFYQGVKIIRLPIWPRGRSKISLICNYFSFLFLGKLWATFTKAKFDIVFTYGLSPILQGEVAILYSEKFKVPNFIYIMDFWPYSIEAVNGIKNKFILKLIKKWSFNIYRKSSKILISSEAYRKDLTDIGVLEEKIIYWPQYNEDFYKAENEDNNQTKDLIKDKKYFYFGFTGNFGKAQGIIEFLIFVNLCKSDLILRKVKFVLIGDGIEKSKIETFVLQNDLNELVAILPTMPAKKIPFYIAKFDAALLLIKQNLHLSKVIPAKLQTYVACEKPIWFIGNGYLAKFIEENKIGFASNSYKSSKILESLDFFIKNYQNFNLSSKRNMFNKDILLNNLINLFNSVE
jgi:hypothetical protein